MFLRVNQGDMMKKFLIIFALFLFGSAVLAADFNVFKLENGQTVVIQEVKNNPIVIVDTWIKTGSIDENDTNNGVAHFLEHLFFKGTKTHGPGEFDKTIENKGGITNAATSKDFTHYYITIPSKYFNLAMEMHADMLQNPLIPGNEMEKERKVVLEEISKDANSPDRLVFDNLVDLMYKTHPYKRKVIGRSDVIETITRDSVLDFFFQNYYPGNMVTVVIGDVNTQDALNKVQNEFSGEIKKVKRNSYKKEQPLKQQVRKTAYANTKSGYMLIGFRSVDINNKDSYALDVLATILGDGRSSIFYQNIKDKKQLAYSIAATNSVMRDDGIFYISANFIPDKLDKLEKTIFEEIAEVQKNGVTQEQVNLAQNIIERDTYYSRESISNIATEIGYTVALTGDVKFYETYLDNIKKVTPQDVKRVANKYLGPDKSAVSIVLPETEKEVQISNKTQNAITANPVGENNGTQKFALSNGATLLLNENKNNDIIAISIYAKGGEFLQSIPGTANLTASLLLKGTDKYTALELAQYLDDNGIKISPSTKADAFMISVLTTKPQLDKTLEILDDIINNSKFDDYELEKARAEKLNVIKRNRDIPIQLALEEYKTLIFEGSPYSNSTKILEKYLPSIQRDDVVKYAAKIFNPTNLVISVNGDVDKDKITTAVGKIFSAKPVDAFDYSKYKVPSLTETKTVTKTIPNLQTDWIVYGWQTSGVMSQKDYATLSVIDAILGSGMSSRLFKNLRDAHGLAYQLGSAFGANILKGAFVVYIGTNPENLDIAQEKLLAEINRLKSEYVSSKELTDAKEKLTGNYIIALETNLEKASNAAWFEASGRGYDFGDKYLELINSVTEADIVEVANKYFTNNYVRSIVKD